MSSDPLADAERELRILTRCTCKPPYPLTSGRHDPDCLTDWREDVDVLAAELGRARERITELEAGREIEQTMLRNAAAQITELERELADAREHIAQQDQILREQGAELREAENDAYIGWCTAQDERDWPR